MYASKTLEQRNNDPMPWVHNTLLLRHVNSGLGATFSPRPEFQHGKLEANPILVEFREMRGADWARPERYLEQVRMYMRFILSSDASSEDDPPWTAIQRAHAFRVFSLWLAVQS